jgi:hypothetical protein
MSRPVVVVAAALGLAGCGARTAIPEGLPDASVQPDAAAEAEAAPPEADAAVVVNGCEAALQKGAPMPMPGYCSTRANVSPAAGPKAPQIMWKQPLPLPTPYEVIETVVDASGQIYATLDTAVSGWVLPDTLVSLDAQGTLLWTKPYGDKVPAALFLAADGLLRFRLNAMPPVLVTMASDGSVMDERALPDSQRHGFAVGRDGTLFTPLWDSTTSTRVAHLAVDATVLWTSASFERCGVSTSPIVLGPKDLAIIGFDSSIGGSDCSTFGATLLAFDASGTTAWQRTFGGTMVHHPAAGPDGAVRIAFLTGSDVNQPIHLASVDTSGEVQWDVQLPGTGINVWVSPMVILPDGVAIVRSNGNLTAVSGSGKILWNVYNDPMFSYGAFADADGKLIVTKAGTAGIDSATGQQQWSLDSLQDPAVMGPGGSILGTAYLSYSERALGLARDP